jgi:hypothetical protein
VCRLDVAAIVLPHWCSLMLLCTATEHQVYMLHGSQGSLACMDQPGSTFTPADHSFQLLHAVAALLALFMYIR